MPLNDVWEVTDIQTVHATRITNVSYWRQDNSADVPTSFNALMLGYLASVSNVWAPQLGVAWQSICREARVVGVTGQAFMRNITASSVGAIAAETLNPATVAVIAKFTATGSRIGTGRSYISGIPAIYEQRNNLTLEGLTAMNAIGATLITPFVQSGITFTPGRAAGFQKDPASTPEVPLPDIATPFEPWVLSDERSRLTKIKSRRLSTRC